MQLEIFEDSHGTHSTQFCDEIWSTLWWVHLGTASGEQNRTINSLDGHPTCKKFDYWGQKPYSHQHMSSLRLHMYHERIHFNSALCRISLRKLLRGLLVYSTIEEVSSYLLVSKHLIFLLPTVW